MNVLPSQKKLQIAHTQTHLEHLAYSDTLHRYRTSQQSSSHSAVHALCLRSTDPAGNSNMLIHSSESSMGCSYQLRMGIALRTVFQLGNNGRLDRGSLRGRWCFQCSSNPQGRHRRRRGFRLGSRCHGHMVTTPQNL